MRGIAYNDATIFIVIWSALDRDQRQVLIGRVLLAEVVFRDQVWHNTWELLVKVLDDFSRCVQLLESFSSQEQRRCECLVEVWKCNEVAVR